jgi:hypothetical protein
MVHHLELNQIKQGDFVIVCDIFRSVKYNSLVIIFNNRKLIFNKTGLDVLNTTVNNQKLEFINAENKFKEYFKDGFHIPLGIIKNFQGNELDIKIEKSIFKITLSSEVFDFTKNKVMTTIQKNEYYLIPSWIKHYKQIGFEKFIIYDNGTLIKEHYENLDDDIFIIHANWEYWSDSYGMNSTGQVIQQNHCLWKYTPEYIGLFDLDEYLNSNVMVFNKNYSVVSFPNKWFGCSNKTDFNYNNFTEKLIMCENPVNRNENRKCIILSKNVDLFCVHVAVKFGGEEITILINENYFRHFHCLSTKNRVCNCSEFCACIDLKTF